MQWYMPVIPVLWEDEEVGGLEIQAYSGQLSKPLYQNLNKGWDVAQRKLGSISSTRKEQNKTKSYLWEMLRLVFSIYLSNLVPF